MLRSMTAYARVAREDSWGQAAWELRSVNNRYLDLSFRLPEEIRPHEAGFRERIGERVKRGKVECSLRLSLAADAGAAVEVDLALARQLADAAASLASLVPGDSRLRMGEMMRWPGVIRPVVPDSACLERPLLDLLDQALDEFLATREREGARIATLVNERCDEIEAIVAEVRERQPELVERARERLRERLSEAMERLDADRVEQEIVIVATKLDVSEELDRLDAHVAEVRRVVGQGGPVGRRLDFLMQELNREANTLGSKSTDTRTTRASVDLKVLIEQIREQIQNVE
jgi:uncharacterized protein (TIGR00255 family)